MRSWIERNIPDLTGRNAIVTGSTGGLGFYAAQGLAQRGATVILASHNADKGVKAVQRIKTGFAESKVSFIKLDLSDEKSIEDFARTIESQFAKLDILICNAGIMMPKNRRMTNYGVESQFGINYLGHFYLTSLLMPLLQSARGRVVTVSSMANNPVVFDLNDATERNRYHPFRLYALSKLAALMFALELDKRSIQNNWGITAVPVHPGLVRTKLFNHSLHPFVIFSFLGTKVPIISMSSQWASHMELFAAASPKAKSGVFYGPLLWLLGGPRKALLPKKALDTEKRNELWQFSERVLSRTL